MNGKLFFSPILLFGFFINITPVYTYDDIVVDDITYSTYIKQAKYLKRVAQTEQVKHIKQAKYLERITRTEQVKYLERVKAIFLKNEISCLTKNIYFEAKNQNARGKLAVGLVTLNRINSTIFPNTVCDVVKQKNIVQVGKRKWRTKCQFSWFCDGKTDKPDLESAAWKTCENLAEALLTKTNKDITNGALYFHADYVNPRWKRKMIFIAKIDDHLFYKPRWDRKT